MSNRPCSAARSGILDETSDQGVNQYRRTAMAANVVVPCVSQSIVAFSVKTELVGFVGHALMCSLNMFPKRSAFSAIYATDVAHHS